MSISTIIYKELFLGSLNWVHIIHTLTCLIGDAWLPLPGREEIYGGFNHPNLRFNPSIKACFKHFQEPSIKSAAPLPSWECYQYIIPWNKWFDKRPHQLWPLSHPISAGGTWAFLVNSSQPVGSVCSTFCNLGVGTNENLRKNKKKADSETSQQGLVMLLAMLSNISPKRPRPGAMK